MEAERESRPDETLLLVDDEPGIRKVLSIALMDRGFSVLTASDGDQALAVFREKAPEIVLLDIKLPGIDGIEVLKKIKQESPDTEVIMITGHGDMELAIKSLKLAATDFITKPIHDDVLSIAIRRARERILMRRKLARYTENLEALVVEQSRRLVEAERQAAVGQAVEALVGAMGNLSDDLEEGLTTFNDMPCLVAVHSLEGRVVAANEVFRSRVSRDLGAPSHAHFEDATPEDGPVAETFRTGLGKRFRQTLCYADGTRVPALTITAPIRGKDGEVALVLEISADQDEVRRLRKELAAAREGYDKLFNEVPCYISVQDRSFRLTEANRRFTEDFDFREGAHCYEVYKGKAGPCTDCPLEKTFADGKPHQWETVVTPKGGKEANVLVFTAPIQNEEGEITHVMEMSTDISQVRRLQDHLSTLGLLMGSVSHGIKGQLARLDAGLYLLNEGLSKNRPEDAREAADILSVTAGFIRKMVLDILYYAKERDLEWEQVSLSRFAEDVAATVAPRLKGPGIRLIRDFDETAGDFDADPAALRSALVNLLQNAVDACVADEGRSGHEIRFSARIENREAVFSVSDNGTGMDHSTREKIFTLFFFLQGKTRHGPGLFLTRETVRQHGGSISVESEPGEGSTFIVRLPATRSMEDSG